MTQPASLLNCRELNHWWAVSRVTQPSGRRRTTLVSRIRSGFDYIAGAKERAGRVGSGLCGMTLWR
jgi:hypothetical protein